MLTSQSVIKYILGLYAREDSLIGPALRSVPLNPTTRQVLSLKRSEQLTYLENLWSCNKERASAAKSATSDLYSIRKSVGLWRRFNQLPCTLETRQARADLLANDDKEQVRILLLGDDDLVAVELSQRGYRHVTVADCDEVLLQRIRDETSALPTPPQIVHADFHQPVALSTQADVVFLDPPYSAEGAAAFLGLAIAAAAPQAKLYLMINPHVVGPSAFGDIKALAVRAGFRLQARREGFNAYPIGIVERVIMRLAWWHYMGVPVRKTAGRELCFFSDCFEFVRA